MFYQIVVFGLFVLDNGWCNSKSACLASSNVTGFEEVWPLPVQFHSVPIINQKRNGKKKTATDWWVSVWPDADNWWRSLFNIEMWVALIMMTLRNSNMILFWTIIFRSTCIPKLLSVPRWLQITHQSWCRKLHLKAKKPITGTISVEWRSDGAQLTCRIWVSYTLKKTPVIHKLQPQMLIPLTNRGRPVSFSLEVTLGPKGELFILTLNLVSYVKWSVGLEAFRPYCSKYGLHYNQHNN